jgi:predicted O-methyltransferase YrrM
MRASAAEHTEAEAALLVRAATGARRVVEIGVAEGGSAARVRQVMDPAGRLTLIDPYFRGKLGVSFSRVTARRLVGKVGGAEVEWIRQRSDDAAASWRGDIDFLFIDGDHAREAVRADWDLWSPHVTERGAIALHDARVFDGGWPVTDDGPVQLVSEVTREGWSIAHHADSAVLLRRT